MAWRSKFFRGNAIEGDSTGEADGFRARLCGEFLQHAEVNLFEASLEAWKPGRDGAADRFIGLARGCSEKTRACYRKHFAENGRLSDSAQDISGPVL